METDTGAMQWVPGSIKPNSYKMQLQAEDPKMSILCIGSIDHILPGCIHQLPNNPEWRGSLFVLAFPFGFSLCTLKL